MRGVPLCEDSILDRGESSPLNVAGARELGRGLVERSSSAGAAGVVDGRAFGRVGAAVRVFGAPTEEARTLLRVPDVRDEARVLREARAGTRRCWDLIGEDVVNESETRAVED